MHEDYVTTLALAPYLPNGVRGLAGRAYRLVESLAGRALTVVIAERYYARMFEDASAVLNYPRLVAFVPLAEVSRALPPDRILYIYI